MLYLFLGYEAQMLHVGKVQNKGCPQRIDPLNPDISLLALQIIHIHACADIIRRTGAMDGLQIFCVSEFYTKILPNLRQQIHCTASAMKDGTCAKEFCKLCDHPICTCLLAACQCTNLLRYTVCFQEGIHPSYAPARTVQDPFQQLACCAHAAAIILQFQKKILVRQSFGYMLAFHLQLQYAAGTDVSRFRDKVFVPLFGIVAVCQTNDVFVTKIGPARILHPLAGIIQNPRRNGKAQFLISIQLMMNLYIIRRAKITASIAVQINELVSPVIIYPKGDLSQRFTT